MIHERNKPCPCGSGKKFKKCCANKKQRITTITGILDSQQLVNNFSIDFKTGVVKLGLDDTDITFAKVASEFGYERKKGRKVLSRVFPLPDKNMLDPHSTLLEYENIVSIDTNTKSTPNGNVCVVVAVLAKPAYKNGSFVLRSLRWSAYEFWNPIKEPEHIGWKVILEAIVVQPEYRKGERYGVIVDSDLNDIESYNERKKGIILDNLILPPRVTFLYATSDSKK